MKDSIYRYNNIYNPYRKIFAIARGYNDQTKTEAKTIIINILYLANDPSEFDNSIIWKDKDLQERLKQSLKNPAELKDDINNDNVDVKTLLSYVDLISEKEDYYTQIVTIVEDIKTKGIYIPGTEDDVIDKPELDSDTIGSINKVFELIEELHELYIKTIRRREQEI